MDYLEFTSHLRGFKFFNKNGVELFKYELFFARLTPTQVFTKYIAEKRVTNNEY